VSGICESAGHPLLAARLSSNIIAALRGRSSAVGMAVADRGTGVTCKLHPHWNIESASVVKVTILCALLRKLQESRSSLTEQQRELATEMITVSDNNAASALWIETGRPSLQHFLDVAGMQETKLGPGGYWGLTQITAHDELILLRLLTSANSVLSPASCNYVLNLMAEVTPSQRWGVTAGAPADVTVHVKNGWLPLATRGWRINSIGTFSGPGRAYAIVVLTWDNPTMAYGIDTVQALAQVINRDLNPGATEVVAPAAPQGSWGTPDEQVPAPPARL
jgi:beta-lactamase class A